MRSGIYKQKLPINFGGIVTDMIHRQHRHFSMPMHRSSSVIQAFPTGFSCQD